MLCNYGTFVSVTIYLWQFNFTYIGGILMFFIHLKNCNNAMKTRVMNTSGAGYKTCTLLTRRKSSKLTMSLMR